MGYIKEPKFYPLLENEKDQYACTLEHALDLMATAVLNETHHCVHTSGYLKKKMPQTFEEVRNKCKKYINLPI